MAKLAVAHVSDACGEISVGVRVSPTALDEKMEEKNEIEVTVIRAEGEKCPRCWKVAELVPFCPYGEVLDHLCIRCAQVVVQMLDEGYIAIEGDGFVRLK